MGFELILPFLRPIEGLILDPEISEIMVNGSGRIFIERHGELVTVPDAHLTEKNLQVAVRNIARALGDEIGEEQPLLDSRLPDGSRVAAVIPPCSIGGTTLTIRKFHWRFLTGDELVRIGTLTAELLAILQKAVTGRRNILISGCTSSGKTTLLTALAAFIADSERIILIEDTAEIQVDKPNLVRFGTNEFHGSTFEYFRNDALDANNWFTNSIPGQTKPALRFNDFGGTLGGPIRKDRLFVFASYEGGEVRQPQTTEYPVLDVATREMASGAGQTLVNAYPLPNGPELGKGLAEYLESVSLPSSYHTGSVRIDERLTDGFSVFGRYNEAPSNTSVLSGPGNFNLDSIPSRTVTLGATWAISARTVAEFRYNYTFSGFSQNAVIDSAGGATPPSSALLLPSSTSYQQSLAEILPIGSGLPTLYLGHSAGNTQDQNNLVSSLSKVSGKHQFKFGNDWRRLRSQLNRYPFYAVYEFASTASFLTGVADDGFYLTQYATNPILAFTDNLSAFVQDSWRATDRLTVTYGLRWDANTPPRNGRGPGTILLAGISNPSAIKERPQGAPLWNTQWLNLAPRVGLAYQMVRNPHHELVVRMGGGLFYDQGYGTSMNALTNGFPSTLRRTVPSLTVPATAAQLAPISADLANTAGNIFYSYPSNLQLPRSWQANVSVEQSIGKEQSIVASYIMALGRRLLRGEYFANLTPAFTTINSMNNNSSSDYNALQLQYKRRLTSGLQTQVAYSWSHSIDDNSDDVASFGGSTLYPPSSDKGNSDFDVKHVFGAAVSYQLPKARGAISSLLSGYSLDAIATVRSGLPFDITSYRTIPGIGSYTFRPDLVRDVPIYLPDASVPTGEIINKAAFSIPSDRQGSLGRNVLRGPGLAELDLALRRDFKIYEKATLTFRIDVFNIFNHANFGNPNGSLTSGTFGTITSSLNNALGSGGSGGLNPLFQVGGPRSLQLSLRLGF